MKRGRKKVKSEEKKEYTEVQDETVWKIMRKGNAEYMEGKTVT
jgi:hypothetical protein